MLLKLSRIVLPPPSQEKSLNQRQSEIQFGVFGIHEDLQLFQEVIRILKYM